MSNKPGTNKEANIRAYYGEVNKFNQNGEYDKAIKSLNKSKSTFRAFEVKGSELGREVRISCQNRTFNSVFWLLECFS